MSTLDQLTQTVCRLSAQTQREVLHYALYLAERTAREEQLSSESEFKRRCALGDALDTAARLNPFSTISDPVAWQREIRQDRVLPEREESAC
ncbi:hypothetical protein CCP2SC5_810009 [Azospirillaceae bacterium]